MKHDQQGAYTEHSQHKLKEEPPHSYINKNVCLRRFIWMCFQCFSVSDRNVFSSPDSSPPLQPQDPDWECIVPGYCKYVEMSAPSIPSTHDSNGSFQEQLGHFIDGLSRDHVRSFSPNNTTLTERVSSTLSSDRGPYHNLLSGVI